MSNELNLQDINPPSSGMEVALSSNNSDDLAQPPLDVDPEVASKINGDPFENDSSSSFVPTSGKKNRCSKPVKVTILGFGTTLFVAGAAFLAGAAFNNNKGAASKSEIQVQKIAASKSGKDVSHCAVSKMTMIYFIFFHE